MRKEEDEEGEENWSKMMRRSRTRTAAATTTAATTAPESDADELSFPPSPLSSDSESLSPFSLLSGCNEE